MAHTIVRDEALDLADALACALSCLQLDTTVRAAMPATWRQAVGLLKSDQAADHRLGYVLLLTTIIETPEAAHTLVSRLRDALQGFSVEAQRCAA